MQTFLLIVIVFLLAVFCFVVWQNIHTKASADVSARQDMSLLRQEMTQALLNFNDSLRQSLDGQLDKMRAPVNEKLQDTLDKRISASFLQVSERLEKVHQGLGEMQNLALGVGDLKRVLSNVKTRGVWGEVQLGALLEQMLSPDQYKKNVKIKPQTTEVVEYAVCLPDGLIPIDAKFPYEDYERILTASESGDAAALAKAGADLERRIRDEAKRIHDKYIEVPTTTDFGVMFLPTESLYAEVMRRPGLSAEVQKKYKIAITGPSTLGAFLTSLQMGFRTLAIQKRSGEVWQALAEVKNEFEKYAAWVDKLQSQVATVSRTLDDATKRTKAINRKLKDVSEEVPALTDSSLPDQIKKDLLS